IHGCMLELEGMLNYLLSERLMPNDLVVFLGDYIDRGQQAKGVIDLLLEFKNKEKAKILFLEGNHENMLKNVMIPEASNEDDVLLHLVNGGFETFLSYGVSPHFFETTEINFSEVARSVIPPEHKAFFLSLERLVIEENFIFVHAGLNPAKNLFSQEDEDLLWIREPFLTSPHNFKKLVVFGHTPFYEVFFHPPFQLGIDTGLVFGNCLTCVELRSFEVYRIPYGSKKGTKFCLNYPYKQSGKNRQS
ncbi:MAG: serine/threonine protein phosphatase, partial [Candidatus Dadabacteria bacterium]